MKNLGQSDKKWVLLGPRKWERIRFSSDIKLRHPPLSSIPLSKTSPNRPATMACSHCLTSPGEIGQVLDKARKTFILLNILLMPLISSFHSYMANPPSTNRPRTPFIGAIRAFTKSKKVIGYWRETQVMLLQVSGKRFGTQTAFQNSIASFGF